MFFSSLLVARDLVQKLNSAAARKLEDARTCRYPSKLRNAEVAASCPPPLGYRKVLSFPVRHGIRLEKWASSNEQAFLLIRPRGPNVEITDILALPHHDDRELRYTGCKDTTCWLIPSPPNQCTGFSLQDAVVVYNRKTRVVEAAWKLLGDLLVFHRWQIGEGYCSFKD